MNLKEKIDNNTTLNYIDAYKTSYDKDDNEIIDIYELSFKFYNSDYIVKIKTEDIEIKHFYLEGGSELFDSFENKIEDVLWPYILDKLKIFDKWFAE